MIFGCCSHQIGDELAKGWSEPRFGLNCWLISELHQQKVRYSFWIEDSLLAGLPELKRYITNCNKYQRDVQGMLLGANKDNS